MAITVEKIGQVDPDDLLPTLRSIFQDLEDQLNSRAQVYVSTDNRIPTTLQKNDVLITVYKGKIIFRVRGAKSYYTLTSEMLDGLTANGQKLLALQSLPSAPGLTHFPDPGNFGFFYNQSTTTFYLCYNFNNVLKKVALT